MASIWQPLRAWTETDPDKLLYAWLNADGDVVDQYTYGTFVTRTTTIARHLMEHADLPVGARVLLAYPPGLEVIAAFFACVRLGLVPVPVYPPTQQGFEAALQKMNFIAEDCGAAAVLTDRNYYWSMKLNHTRHRLKRLRWSTSTVMKLPWIVSSDATAGTGDVPERHHPLLFLQYTSGSTSDPKGVMVPHEAVLHNGDAVVDHLPVGVSWLPQYHDMGLIGYYLFFALKGGTTYGFSPLDFIRRPALWLQAISRYRGTASSAPNFAYEYCLRPGKLSDDEVAALDLSSLRFLMNAAEPVRAPVYQAFLRKFSTQGLQPRAFFSAYGLAEYTLAVCNYGRRVAVLDRDALQAGHALVGTVAAPSSSLSAEPSSLSSAPATPETNVSLVSCGTPLTGASIAIVDVHASPPRRLADGDVGEVWVRGPSVCQGYWGREELSEATFRAPLDGHRWLRTGDLGFLDDGELFLCGRSKDLIIIRGQNFHPQDFERAVEEDPAVRPGGVAAFAVDVEGSERAVVVVEVRSPQVLPDPRALQASVQRSVGTVIDTFVFVAPRCLPKTSSGKLRRHQAREWYETGRLTILAKHHGVGALPSSSSPSSPVSSKPADHHPEAGLVALLARYGIAGHETITLPEAGLDSIQLVDFAHALKDHLTATGHREMVAAVEMQVLQSIAICELMALMAQLRDASPAAKLRFRQAFGVLSAEHRAQEQAMMRRDTRLTFDPAHLPRLRSKGSSSSPSSSSFSEMDATGPILLTGATGFFGPFLLASLLTHTQAEVRVLVRAADASVGKARVLAGLRAILGDGVNIPWEAWNARLTVLCGDLARTNLGLSTRVWQQQAEEVAAIFHNGAWVNYLYDYAAMRDANVGGTNEVVRLAMSHRPSVLNHISTTFIFGWSSKDTLFERDTNDDLDLLDFGYAQTKWAAEHVVRDAMGQGLVARIFRPALITPSVTGAGTHFDISVRLLAFMLNHGLGTTAQNQVSFSPADVTAQNIVAIATQSESVGQTYHVTRDAFSSLGDVTALLSTSTGRRFAHLPLEAFVPEVISRCQPGDILFPLLEFFVRSTDNITAMEFKRYDNSTYRYFRDRSPIGRVDPSLDDVVAGLLRFMRRQGVVDV